ncbi:MAG TPA: hypothetical protein VFE62_01375 [Gemmataceae bacterium]|nr:hypothetical protein [Gemmataceae bacterium]
MIDELTPDFPAQGVKWAQCLSYWEAFRGQFPDQAVAIARVISKRAMREFGLAFDSEGRVVEKNAGAGAEPETVFTLEVYGKPVEVSHQYSPRTGSDSVSFSAADNPLSETGFWHIFVPHDVVDALGGPETFAAQIAEAKLAGAEKEFMAAFEGEHPWRKAVGKHTEAVASKAAGASVQGGLFEE